MLLIEKDYYFFVQNLLCNILVGKVLIGNILMFVKLYMKMFIFVVYNLYVVLIVIFVDQIINFNLVKKKLIF